MLVPICAVLLASISYASPILEVRTVTALTQPDTDEAHQVDNTATRAFSATEVKTSDGKCLFVNPLSGDFRANTNPIQVADCDGSTGQLWDIITKGKHNDQAGTMLVVNTLTQACMNFDPRRAAGNQVNMFSCGGRADGGGIVTNSQLFPFAGGAGPLSLAPINQAGTCFTVTSGDVLDQAACNAGDATQSFTFGGSGIAASSVAITTSTTEVSSSTETPPVSIPSTQETVSATATFETLTQTTAAQEAVSATTTLELSTSTPEPACVSTTMVTVTRFIDTTSGEAAATSVAPPESSVAEVTTQVPEGNPATATTKVPVSGAGGFLNPTSVAEAQIFDPTDTRALTGVSIKSSSGKCLFIDPTAGDFRENLVPIAVQDCTGSPNEKFDFITAGAHNNAANSTLIVSSLTNGCVSFDPRRAVLKAHVFSCGGRADGGGKTSDSQLFPFAAGTTSLELAPENQKGAVCLVDVGGQLDEGTCTGDATFTIG